MQSLSILLGIILFSQAAYAFSNNHKNQGLIIQSQRQKYIFEETKAPLDTLTEAYLKNDINHIIRDINSINAVPQWTKIDSINLEQSTEGGYAKYYYLKNELKKITACHYGETGQSISEYYLKNGKLIFLIEQSAYYNRPIYYDTLAMQENDDDESLNPEHSEITLSKSFFKNNQLIHQLNSDDCGAPFSTEYLMKEQVRIENKLKSLKTLAPKQSSQPDRPEKGRK